MSWFKTFEVGDRLSINKIEYEIFFVSDKEVSLEKVNDRDVTIKIEKE